MPTDIITTISAGITHCFIKGLLHSKKFADGTVVYYDADEKIHKDDGPAIEYASGTKHWYKHGKLHREEGPAIEFVGDGQQKHFYLDGVRLSEEEYAKVRADKVNQKPEHKVITTDGTTLHYKGAVLHRDDGPAIIYKNGFTTWYKDGLLHREDGPAIDCGHKVYYFIEGNSMNKEQFENRNKVKSAKKDTSNDSIPSGTFIYVASDGTIFHRVGGQLHRDIGPAVEYKNGNKHWYKNGYKHREDGPAIEHIDGHKEWWIKGRLHREDGPAISALNVIEYYLDGLQVTPKEFQERMEKKEKDKMNTTTTTLTPPNVKDFVIKGDSLLNNKDDISDRNYLNMDGELHREDGPAVIKNGNKRWYSHDRLHRIDGPAIEWKDGGKEWWVNGKRHRPECNGPALIYSSGHKEWWLDGKCHRDNGPAMEFVSGTKNWLKNDKLHREDGPASIVVFKEGEGRYWYQNGKLHRFDGPAVELPNGRTEWWFDGVRLSKDKPVLVVEDKLTIMDKVGNAADYITSEVKDILLTIKDEIKQGVRI